ncbi:O-antigen ligase family protein [Candidatus Peregrinibacteria bacterium]|nr:O-antigen ligase family protein [Candidatus Peregrinibacteria bacterium]
MQKILDFTAKNFSTVFLSAIFLLSLLNPVFKKYDYGAEYPMILAFALIFVCVAIYEFRQKKERSLWEILFVLIFLGAVAMSFVFSQMRNTGFSEVLAFFTAFSMYLLFAHRKGETLRQVLHIVAFGTVIAVFWGYLQYLLMPETRMFGPFMNLFYHANEWPNAFALFLIMAWPVFVLLYGKKWSFRESLLLGFVLSAVLLTFSRGALIVLLGQFLIFAIYFARRVSLKKLGAAFLVLIVAVGMFFGVNNIKSQRQEILDVGEKLRFANEESVTSKVERMDFWLGAIQLIKEKPLFGWGPFSFRQAYNPIQKTLLGSSDHPHNIFLKIGAENGLVALAAFFGFLISIFVIVLKRFKILSGVKKDEVFILGVAISGAFAHNLIDYNLNFWVNLMLLFALMAFLRSLVAFKVYKVKKTFSNMMLFIIIAVFAAYEAGILFMSESIDKDFLSRSFYPRNYYLEQAEKAVSYNRAIVLIDRHLAKAPIDSEGYFLKGKLVCEAKQNEICEENLRKAISLNPKNNLNYYLEYYRHFESGEILMILPLIEQYFEFAEKNVHFTAYTKNVEAAAEISDIMMRYLPAKERSELEKKKEKMLNKVAEIRAKKLF